MQDQQRQTYLSLLGIDSYIPRWELVGAKVSEICADTFDQHDQIIVETSLPSILREELKSSTENYNQSFKTVESVINELTPLSEFAVVKTLLNEKKHITKTAVLNNDNQTQLLAVTPFTLGVWSSDSGLMIVDSRDAQQALPTELLLQNMMNYFGLTLESGQPELIRWPLVENKFTSQTVQNAREEIQTWFSVQKDIHPIKCVLVMGEMAAKYLLSESVDYEQVLNSERKFVENQITFLVSQSLNEILRKPSLKRHLLNLSSTLTSVIHG